MVFDIVIEEKLQTEEDGIAYQVWKEQVIGDLRHALNTGEAREEMQALIARVSVPFEDWVIAYD